VHSNGLVVVGVTSFHPLLAAKSPVVKVSFTTGKNKRDLADLKPKGKKKKGALFTQAETVICEVTVASGKVYSLRACIRGSLLEVNTRLLANPALLTEKPTSDGYIAIISVKPFEWDAAKTSLKTGDEYAALRQRQQQQD